MNQYPPTYRCGMCGINWPFAPDFAECPRCTCENRSMRVKDHVLTWEEARELVEDKGTALVQTRKGRDPSPQELQAFRIGLDHWVEMDPEDKSTWL